MVFFLNHTVVGISTVLRIPLYIYDQVFPYIGFLTSDVK